MKRIQFNQLKMTGMVLAFGGFVAAAPALASAGGPMKDLMLRVTDQVSDVAAQYPGVNAIANDAEIRPEDAWQSSKFNPLRMICMAHHHAQYLAGYADLAKVKKKLGVDFEPTVQNFGFGRKGVPIFIGATWSQGFRGCSCPPEFREFTVQALIQNPGWENPATLTPASVHVAPLYFATNHLKRQETMVHKFSIPEDYAGLPVDDADREHIRFIGTEDRAKGFELRDQTGHVVFAAKRRVLSIPRPETVIPMADYLSYGRRNEHYKFSGSTQFDLFHLDGFQLPGQFFRVQERDHKMGFDPSKRPPLSALYIRGADSYSYDPESAVGKVLDEIDFHPVVWTSEVFTDSMAWTPKPLATY